MLQTKLCKGRGKLPAFELFNYSIPNVVKESVSNIALVSNQGRYYTVLPGYIWPAASADEAVMWACMAHYVFNTIYPPRHELVYSIVERLLNINEELCTKVRQPAVLSLLKFT